MLALKDQDLFYPSPHQCDSNSSQWFTGTLQDLLDFQGRLSVLPVQVPIVTLALSFPALIVILMCL